MLFPLHFPTDIHQHRMKYLRVEINLSLQYSKTSIFFVQNKALIFHLKYVCIILLFCYYFFLFLSVL